jgi:hypothetical protein
MDVQFRKLMLFYGRLSLSLTLVAYFIYAIDFKGTLKPITSTGWLYLGLTAVLANLDRFLMAYKWNVLLRAKGMVLHFGEVIRSYYIGTFWGTFLPSGVGGDIVRAYRVSVRNGNSEEVISSIVVERLLGMIATFILALVGLSCFGLTFTGMMWPLFFGVGTICTVGVLFLFVSFSGLISGWITTSGVLQKHSWATRIARVWNAYLLYRQQPRALVAFFLLSLGEQGFPVASSLFVARALDLSLPGWSFLILVPIIFALSRIPISVNGFGVREGLYIFFFSYVGLSGSEAFVLGLLTHLVVIASILPGFFYASFYVPSPVMARSHASV